MPDCPVLTGRVAEPQVTGEQSRSSDSQFNTRNSKGFPRTILLTHCGRSRTAAIGRFNERVGRSESRSCGPPGTDRNYRHAPSFELRCYLTVAPFATETTQQWSIPSQTGDDTCF